MTEFSEEAEDTLGVVAGDESDAIAERFDELRKPAEGFASLPIEWRVHLGKHRVIALDDKRVFRRTHGRD